MKDILTVLNVNVDGHSKPVISSLQYIHGLSL